MQKGIQIESQGRRMMGIRESVLSCVLNSSMTFELSLSVQYGQADVKKISLDSINQQSM